jgi:hypothetical protein
MNPTIIFEKDRGETNSNRTSDHPEQCILLKGAVEVVEQCGMGVEAGRLNRAAAGSCCNCFHNARAE